MSTHILKRFFWLFLTLSIVISVALNLIGASLTNSITPYGIISFEFCGFTSTCEAALVEWGVKGRELAMLSLGMDFLFLILYPGFICTGLLLVASHVPINLYKFILFAAWSSPALSLTDSIENFALIQIILNKSTSTYGFLASTSATIKFIIFGITFSLLFFIFIKYVFISWLSRLGSS